MAIVPSVSVACAETVMLPGAVEVALFGGLVRLTVGGTLAGGLMVKFTATESVAAPELSVALAVILYVPTGAFGQLKM